MRYLFLALQFYTRIPTPTVKDYRPEDANKVMRCFSLIGWIVGLIYAVAFIVGQYLFGTAIGVILSLAAGILATGCFHEDGFADMCDGFGGGSGKQRILDIMKDSRIGTYGTVGLVLLLTLKIGVLFTLMSNPLMKDHSHILLLFVAYHSIARATAGSMVFISKYSRNDGTSKIKPVEKSYTGREIGGLFFFAAVPVVLSIYVNPWYALILLPLGLLVVCSKRYVERKIDGYTGDCLGAIEQIAELIILLSLAIFLKII